MAKSLISVDDVYNYTQQKTQKTKKKNKSNDVLDTISKYSGLIGTGGNTLSIGSKILGGLNDINTSTDGSWIKSGEGSVGKKIGATTLSTLGNITEGGLNAFEGISDWGRETGADFLELFGATNKAKKLREEARENTTQGIVEDWQHIIQGDLAGKKTKEEIAQDDWISKSSVFGEKTNQVFQGVGNSVANALMSSYLGGASAGLNETTRGILGLTPMYMSASGSGRQEAIQSGATEGQARLYGMLSGVIESGSEMMFGGLGKLSQTLGFSKGALDDVFINSLTSRINNTLLKNGIDLAARGVGEGLEEVASGFFGAMAKKLTYMKDEDIRKLWEDEKLWDSFVSGALSSVIMEAPSHVSSTIQGREASTGITKNENKVIDAIVEEQTKEQNLTKKEVNEVRQQVREDLQNGYITPEQIEQVLGKDYDVKDDTYLQESYREQQRRRTGFNTDLSQYKNESQRKIVQKAIDSGILNDSKKTHNFVDLVSKLAADKGMDFDFVNNQKLAESGFAVNGKTVNGYVNGNTIGLNIDSVNALNKTLGHEITHVLEGSDLYQELQNSLKEYIGQKEWNSRLNELAETYKNVKNANVENELTSDLVGENLFNNKDFVRSLSTKNMNLFEKIFDEIKYMVKIATAGSKEKRQLVKLQKVFQEAYRDSKTTREGTQYSIQGLENYTEQEIKDISNDYIQNILSQNGLDDVEIVDTAIHGSRGRGTARADSDLDLVVQYKGDIREDDLFNALNDNGEDNLYIEGIRVDINPIQEDLSSYMERSNQYDEEIKKNTKYSLSDVENYVANKGYKFQTNGNLEVNNLTDKQIKDLVKLYHTTGYEDVSAEYLTERLKSGQMPIMREVADRFIEKELGYKPQIDTTQVFEDAEGNPLTKEQVEFYKNSGVRDIRGRLIPVYHRTDADFTIFDDKAGTQHGKKYGKGFYFSITPENYGNNTMKVYLNAKDGEFKYVPKMGYYIVQEANQIKNVDNKAPTNNPDIRYSLSVEEANTTQDNEGRKLNDNQLAYFKDSKIRNDNGELEVVYHTTPNQFTVFDSGRAGENTGYDNTAFGSFVTTNRNFSERFGDINEEGTKGNTMEMYANITNPITHPYNAEYKYSGEQLDNIVENWFNAIGETEALEELKSYVEDGEYDSLYQAYRNTVEFSDESPFEYASDERERLQEKGYDGVEFVEGLDKDVNYNVSDSNEPVSSYAVFDSNQLKNIDNTNPTNDADIRYQLGTNEIAPTRGWDVRGRDIALEQALAPVKEQINQLQEAIEELAPITEEEAVNLPVNENIEEPSIERPQEIAPTRQTADEMLLPIQQATRETEVKNKRQIEPRKKNSLRQAYETVVGGFVNRNVLIDDLSKRSKNTAIKFKGDMWSNYMGEGQSNISNYQTDINGNAIGEGVNKIFENAENAGIPSAVFNEFLIDYSNIDRWRNNKGSQTPYEESARRLREYSIKYPQIKQYAQKVWKYGENSLQNRVDAGLMSKETAETLRKLYPHYVPYISQTEDIDTYYKKLNELKPLTIKRARGGAGALLPVQEALAQYTMSEKKSIRQNALFNEIIDTIGEGNNFGADEKSDYTGMTDSLFTDENGAYLTAYKDGKQRTATIDMDLYNELSRTNDNQVKDIEERLSLITNPLQKVSEIRRNVLTTWSPSFVFKNAIKDIQEAAFNSKYTKDMLKNYLPAFKELRNMDTKEAQQFVSLYGSGLTQGEFLNDTINESTRNVKGLNWLKNVNEIVELAPRYAEFKASLQNGATLEEAMYNAREVTTNFGRGGTIAKALNRNGFTFLNSSIQGFDKLVRNFSGENGAKGVAATLAKAVMFGIVPAVFNELAFGSGDDKDEEYEALPDYIKDNYYLIKFGDENFIRIPKGRVLSIFGSAARRTIEAAEGEEGAFDGFLENAWSQTGVNNPAENNIFAPLIQAAQNRAWYGGDIVPSRLQDKPENEQYDASVDNFSIWLSNTALGKKMGLSPYKVNYVLDQYTGGIGDIALPMITEEAKSNGSLLAPVVDQFTADSTTDNKYVSDFYSKKEEITKLSNGSNATDEEQLQKKYLDNISSQMSELYKEKREVQADKSLSKKEKYEKSQNIKKEINRLAKEGLDNYQNVSVSGDFAEINGNNYQKGEDGKWKKVKEKTQDDTKALGLTGNESDNYVKTTENIKNIKDTYSNSTVKKQKVISEIKNSNLPKEAKLQLYKDNYKDQMVDNYIDLGMDINSYLDYKTQDFTADKDKYGKSISGSKKQKVFDYINNMNIPFEQKIMLAKQEYPNYNEYNQEIIDYLNRNNNIDYNEMEKILLDLGFKVDEQGNISW